jgi:hypothetical protein
MAIRSSTITRRHTQHGAAVVECALLLALIAVVCIVALSTMSSESSSSSRSDLPAKGTTATTPSPVATSEGMAPATSSQTAPQATSTQTLNTLDCARVYRSKAVAALNEAEDHGTNESVYLHLERAQTYLEFAREADKHQQQNCLLGGS